MAIYKEHWRVENGDWIQEWIEEPQNSDFEIEERTQKSNPETEERSKP